jgi:hypothetical protein
MSSYQVPTFLAELLHARSPSGYEAEAQAVFDRHVKPSADAYTGDHASAPALLFGKVAKDRYSLDFSPGCLGPMQAFAIALSTFASKLAVA